MLIKVLSVFNFRNLVGVEIDEELCQIARNNFEDEILENRILFLNQDVLDLSLDWKFPVYILFNPFGRETLVKFTRKVCLENSQAHIIYINDLHSNVLTNDFVKVYSNHLLKISVWERLIATNFRKDGMGSLAISSGLRFAILGPIDPNFEVAQKNCGRATAEI